MRGHQRPPRHDPPPAPVAGCPPWCAVDHAEDDGKGYRDHRRTVAIVGTYTVDVAALDDLRAGTRIGPVVELWGPAGLTPAEARLLVCQVLDAVDLIERCVMNACTVVSTSSGSSGGAATFSV